MDTTFIDRVLGERHPLHHLRGAGLLPVDRRRAGRGALGAQAMLPAARLDQRPELRHHRADRGALSQGAAFRGLPGDVRLRDPRRGSTWSTSTATLPAASGWRRSCCSSGSIARTTGSTASPTSTTPPGPGTWCTIRARITTWRWRCGRGRFRGSSRGSSTCRWRCWDFRPRGSPRWSSFDTLYQFWIHTRTIGKLGPLEWVLNTPSHHRVHHARNPKYLDKNYAGTLIIWDRMFGTFQAEEEEPVYGLTKPLEQLEPAVGQPARVARIVSATPGWRRGGSTSSGSGSCRRAGGPRDCPPTPPPPR